MAEQLKAYKPYFALKINKKHDKSMDLNFGRNGRMNPWAHKLSGLTC